MGMKFRRVNDSLTHPDMDFIRANIDRRTVGERSGLEIKFRDSLMLSQYGESGTDEVLESDLIQCQHYLAVTGWDLWRMAVLFGNRTLRTYEIPRDDGLIESLLDLDLEFWEHVETDTPPEIDFEHRSTKDLLAKLYPGTSSRVLTLPEEAIAWHQAREAAAEQEKTYKAVKDGATKHLLALIEDGAVGILPGLDGAGYTRKLVKRKGYTVEPTEYVDFRFSKHPKGT